MSDEKEQKISTDNMTAVGMLVLTACVIAVVCFFTGKFKESFDAARAASYEVSVLSETVSEDNTEVSNDEVLDETAPDENTSEENTADETKKELPVFVEINEPVYVTADTDVFLFPDLEAEKKGTLHLGDSLMRTGLSPEGWDRVEFEGETAYVPHDRLCGDRIGGVAVKPENQPESAILAKDADSADYPEGWYEYFNNMLLMLQSEYPDGKYWNHMGEGENGGVTEIPCDHEKYGTKFCNQYLGESCSLFPGSKGIQCLGFASLLSDLVFGEDAPLRSIENYDEIRIGDQARINNNSHSVFIVDKTDEYVIVAECNKDYKTCKIEWGRKIKRKTIEKGFCITRWD